MSTQAATHTHKHQALQTTFKGVSFKKEGIDIVQYRGIEYGRITERFAKPELVTPSAGKEIDGTRFGPECPQPRRDIRQLFCVPSSYPDENFEQDEFRCLNLTITTPLKITKPSIPVMIWIHGGGHLNSIEGPESRMSDTGRFVADSVNLDMPIIVVGLNYRLNIFALGDGSGERNLSLQDQACAIDWVVKHISGFGGDPENITLAGESAGGICIHAHSIMGTPAKRMILQSGTLYTIPPLPLDRGASFLDKYNSVVKSRSGKDMKDASAQVLLDTMAELKISSMWLDLTPELEGWQSKEEKVEELMIGDCEFESILWLDVLRKADSQSILQCFDSLPKAEAQRVLSAYGIDDTSSQVCRRGALNLIGDYKFSAPPVKIADRWRASGKKVYQYLVDEVNPFRQSLGAHHGVDILYLFGDYDMSKTPHLARTGSTMRQRWVQFVNGQKPWDGALCAFGPLGVCDVLDDKSTSNRRRLDNFNLIDDVRPRLEPVIDRLTQGRFQNRKSKM